MLKCRMSISTTLPESLTKHERSPYLRQSDSTYRHASTIGYSVSHVPSQISHDRQMSKCHISSRRFPIAVFKKYFYESPHQSYIRKYPNHPRRRWRSCRRYHHTKMKRLRHVPWVACRSGRSTRYRHDMVHMWAGSLYTHTHSHSRD